MSELKSTNIRSAFASSFCLRILEQTITGPVLVLYLYQIALGVQGPVRSVSTEPNSLVGVVMKLLAVAPIGWLVDRDPTRRVRPLPVSLVFGLATVIIGGFLLHTDEFALATVLTSCCGIFIELCKSASRSILTDSIREGKREGIFVTQWVCYLLEQWVCYLLGAASGPFLAVVTILASASSSANHVKLALVCGLVVLVPIASIIFTFVDPLSMERGPKTHGNDRVNVSNSSNLSAKSCTGRWVPILCVTLFLVSVFAGGLIVPFFILFENDVHLSLVQVNLLEGCSCFFITRFSKGAWISKHFGRAPTMLSMFTLCTALMALTFMLRFGFPSPILMIMFLFRRGLEKLGKCIKPLLDSVVADFTPSTEQGMWTVFLSIGVAGWAASALLGGILADQHGYTSYSFVIFITSLVYAGSLLLLMPLVGLVSDQTECPDPVEAEESEADAEGSEEVP